MRKLFLTILIHSSLITFGQNSSIDDLWKLYNSHAYQSVIDKATPLLENDPNNIDLNLLIGRSFADLGEFKNARTFLEFVVSNDKNNSWRKAWALSNLGTCYFILQDYEKSEFSLNECIQLNATKNATNSSYGQTLLFGFHAFYKTWKMVETDNFRFHFQNMSDTDIEKYITQREKAYIEINEFFKSALPKKMDFYVWESRDDAKKTLRADLGFAKPIFCVVHTHYQQTIGHEMTHIIAHYSTNVSTITKFINEGTAVNFDLSSQDRIKKVNDWIQKTNQKIDILDIWNNGDDYEEEILYPLSGLFVRELIANFGREKFLEFFGNQTYDNAKLVFGDKLDQLINEFESNLSALH